MKYIVNLTHKRSGKGKVRTLHAETTESAKETMEERYPNYDIGRIYADRDASVSKLYEAIKEAKRESE